MQFRPRHLVIRWFLPLVWRFHAESKARLALEFAQTELDSAWQSLFAFDRVADPEIRGMLLNHAIEELYHSDLFSALAKKKSVGLPVLPLTRREPLLELRTPLKKDAVEFLAYLSIGESEIRHDFALYEGALNDADMRQLFHKIRIDEEHHADDSTQALEQLTRANGMSLRWLRLRHLASLAYKRYLQIVNKIGVIPMTLLLSLSYFIFVPIFLTQARRRLRMSPKEQLALFRQQKDELDRRLARDQGVAREPREAMAK